MSRAYRICVSESLRKVIKAQDHVSTHLEILNVLPPEEMAALLAEELQRRGFQPQGDQLVREEDGIQIVVDPAEGTVMVQIAVAEQLDLKGEKEDWTYERDMDRAKKAAREKLQNKLEQEASAKQAELQSKLTDQLEAQLGDLRRELDQVANQVTAAALKKKASQMGQIKEISEDAESGSMTIVLEV